MKSKTGAGFTLIEVLVSISLLGLLSTGMLMAIRIALNSQQKANVKLMENRRVVGAQRALEQELNNFVPAFAMVAASEGSGRRVPFFDGEPLSMRFVSSYSLNDAYRGLPQMLEFAVIRGDTGEGVRLIVNELPYRGPVSAGSRIAGFQTGDDGQQHPVFFPVEVGGNSFVLADKLAYCKMMYLEHRDKSPEWVWREDWQSRNWPAAIRIEMAPLEVSGGKLHPMTITAEVHANRHMEMPYVD